MIVGKSVLADSIKKIEQATDKVAKRILENGRYSVSDKASAACRIRFVKETNELILFGGTREIFATDRVPVESDADDDDFVIYTYPYTVLEQLLNLSTPVVKIKKTARGADFIANKKEKFSIYSKLEFAEFFESYTDIPPVPQGTEINISAMDLKDAIGFTSYIPNGNEIRTQVVVFRAHEGNLSVGATDGFRASIYNDIAKIDEEFEIALPANTANTFARMLSGEDGDIKIYFSKNMVYIKNMDFVSGGLTASDKHDIWSLVNTHRPEKSFVVKPELDLLIPALRFASTISEDGAGYISISVFRDYMIVFASGDNGDTTWKINLKNNTDIDDFKIKVNPSFMTQYISKSTPKEMSIMFSESERPFFIESEAKNKLYFAMPLMIG